MMDWTTTRVNIPTENFNTDVVYGGNSISYIKLGRFVFLHCQPLHFKVDADTTAIIATGLPAPEKSGMFFTATCAANDGGKIRLRILNNGSIALGGVGSKRETDEYWAWYVYLAKE